MAYANGGRNCRRRMHRGLLSGVALALGGLTASPGVGSAGASDTIGGTQVEVPVPLPAPIRGDDDSIPAVPDGGGGGGTTPSTTPTTVAPRPSTTAGHQAPPSGDPASAGGRSGRTSKLPRARSGATSTPAVDPTVPVDPEPASLMYDGHATVERLRRASVPAARQFSLPLALGALVLAFLAVQGRLDKRDPKLVVAPITVADDLLPFA